MEELKKENFITKEFYYGTNKTFLVNTESLDANFNAENVFEYGNGIYFTDNESIAKQYISRNLLEDLAKNNAISFNTIKNPTFKIGKLHKFGVNFIKLQQNEEYEEINSIPKLKNELKNSIYGYKKNGLEIGYKPDDRYFTYGLLVGQPWDDYWNFLFYNKDLDNKNKELLKITPKEIDNLINRCCEQLNSNVNQICIHKNSTIINEDKSELRNLNSKYFSYLGECEIKYIA